MPEQYYRSLCLYHWKNHIWVNARVPGKRLASSCGYLALGQAVTTGDMAHFKNSCLQA